MRSRSASSSQVTNRGYRDDDILSEREEEDVDDVDELEAEDASHRVRLRGKAPAPPDGDEGESPGDADDDDQDPITTLKDRQSLINVQHPFGLPIWKPALYKKSRSVTRHADEALHSVPSAQAERHLLPGNLFWTLVFGWWLGAVCIIISCVLWLVPQGGERYSTLVYGLGWYLFWPFGKYVERPEEDEIDLEDEDENQRPRRFSEHTIRGHSPFRSSNGGNASVDGEAGRVAHFDIPPTTPGAFGAQDVSHDEATALLGKSTLPVPVPNKSYGTAAFSPSLLSGAIVDEYAHEQPQKGSIFGKLCFWLFLISIIAPLLLVVCTICWALVVTIPMAKLNWVLLKNLFAQPTKIRFCAVPLVVIASPPPPPPTSIPETEENGSTPTDHATSYSVKQPRLSAGQEAPSGSRILLCTYRAVGLQYYKYTVGGVNILFVNLIPVVFFVIFDGKVLLPLVEERLERGEHVPAFLAFIASQGLIFLLSLLSVIPLSYFIGMAVASISAQSSIGMGAVINATFGSIIEIILYAIALSNAKGHLVEGSIVGSLLAGVLLMPGMSMVSSALRRKEQTFNAKSASVTSMMLIMAIIGALTPTLFYQTYGNVNFLFSLWRISLTDFPWLT